MITIGENKIRYIEGNTQGCDVYQGTTLIHKNPSYEVGSPTMTSNSAPSPYTVYSNSVYNSTYPVWKAFDDIDTNRWTSAANTFTSDGMATGDFPYLWLDLGNTANAKRFCRMDITVQGNYPIYFPRAMTLGYSNDNSVYTYLPRINDLDVSMWDAAGYTLTFYFEAPTTPQRYWSLTIRETNNGLYTHIKRLKYYTDSNN